jgi:hypothetical protein
MAKMKPDKFVGDGKDRDIKRLEMVYLATQYTDCMKAFFAFLSIIWIHCTYVNVILSVSATKVTPSLFRFSQNT